MEYQPTILSTKTLTASQKQLLLNADIAVVEYDSITTEPIPFKLDDTTIKNAIFTSGNAVRAIKDKEIKIENCFCVGEKTKALLSKNGYAVKEMTKNAATLAEVLVDNYQNENFHFFCGNIRRDELPEALDRNDIEYQEVVVYETLANLKEFDRIFDGVFFFSPSGIKSFLAANYIEDSIAFCIGHTTADEIKTYTDKVIIANRPTVENVIVQAVKYF